LKGRGSVLENRGEVTCFRWRLPEHEPHFLLVAWLSWLDHDARLSWRMRHAAPSRRRSLWAGHAHTTLPCRPSGQRYSAGRMSPWLLWPEVTLKSTTLDYKGAKLYFCCSGCPKEFQKSPAKFAANANHQLVATLQAKQTSCPLCGGDLKNPMVSMIG